MKIAFLVDKSAPWYVGGYEDRVWNLARKLSAQDEVRVFTSLDANCRLESVEFERCAPRTFHERVTGGRSLPHSLLFSVCLLHSPFRSWVPDRVILEAIPYVQLWTVRRWITSGPWKTVLNINEAWSSYSYFRGVMSSPSRAVVNRSLQTAVNYSDGVIAISRNTSNHFKKKYRPKSIRVIPMGVDFSRDQLQRPNALSRSIDICSIGRLVSIKRVNDVVRALSYLKSETGWDGECVIAGEGPLRGSLESLTRSLGLGENIEFVGLIDDNSKFDLLRRSKTFVLASEREGFSLVTLEAMACGAVPVVARPELTELFGVSELVENRRTGLTFPVGDYRELARQLQSILQSTQERETLASRAIDYSKDYDWNRIAVDLRDYLLTMEASP